MIKASRVFLGAFLFTISLGLSLSIFSQDLKRFVDLALEPLILTIEAVAKKILVRAAAVKRVIYVTCVSLVVFSIGYFSLACAVSVASCTAVLGFFLTQRINRMTSQNI